ncbi:MAG: 30S ribosomal protein S6 [Patescibacteria group bacterium]
MRTYELFCVLPGTLAETDVAPVLEKVQEVIAKEGGTDIVVQDMGKSRLAYPMRHIRYGYFRICRFHADPDSAARVQSGVRLMNAMLRVMLFQDDGASKMTGHVLQPVDRIGAETATVSEIRSIPEAVEVKKTADVKTETKKSPEGEERTTPVSVPFEDIDKQLDKLLEKDIAGV